MTTRSPTNPLPPAPCPRCSQPMGILAQRIAHFGGQVTVHFCDHDGIAAIETHGNQRGDAWPTQCSWPDEGRGPRHESPQPL